MNWGTSPRRRLLHKYLCWYSMIYTKVINSKELSNGKLIFPLVFY